LQTTADLLAGVSARKRAAFPLRSVDVAVHISDGLSEVVVEQRCGLLAYPAEWPPALSANLSRPMTPRDLRRS
jgi:hypothetical protein